MTNVANIKPKTIKSNKLLGDICNVNTLKISTQKSVNCSKVHPISGRTFQVRQNANTKHINNIKCIKSAKVNKNINLTHLRYKTILI